MISLSLHSAVMGVPASILEGALVLLPRPRPFPRLARLRAPVWAALLPASIIVGTFGLLVFPGLASTTVLAAAITTPLFALLAVLAVVRARSLMLPLAAVAAALAIWAGGAGGHVGTGVVTALACLAVGAALQRLIPGRWMLIGVVAMSVVDATLLFSGPGYHETALLAAATTNFHGPRFTGARIGGTTIGYPDLFLAALLGTSLAGDRAQVWGAGLLTVLAVAYDSMLTPGLLLPATVPIAITLLVVGLVRRGRGVAGPALGGAPVSAAAPVPAGPPVPAAAPVPAGPPVSAAAPALAPAGPSCEPETAISDTRAPGARTARRTCPQHASAHRGSPTPPRGRSRGR
jgi:hypothetical protein